MEQGYILCILMIFGVYNPKECIFKALFLFHPFFPFFIFIYPCKGVYGKEEQGGKTTGFRLHDLRDLGLRG